MKKRWMKLAAIGIMAGTMLIQTPVSAYTTENIVATENQEIAEAPESDADDAGIAVQSLQDSFEEGRFVVVNGAYKFQFNNGSWACNALYVFNYANGSGYAKYAFDADGYLLLGWVQTTDGKTYYFTDDEMDEEDEVYFLANGVWQVGEKYYAFDNEGVRIQGRWYCSRRTGVDLWVYLDAKDGHAVTGWNKINGKWYYMDSDGVMLKGWQKISGKWYYMNGSGAMVTGWNKIGGKWYYMNGNGAMLTGWNKIGGKWYYMNGSGAMLTGWNKISGKWYYMNGSGAMLTGWQKIGGKWYYMNGSGVMLTGKQKINGKWYQFNASGVWIK